MIQLFKHVLECGTNSKQWNRFQKMNHVLDNGTCPRERNLFQRMKHAQENGTYSINGTFSREWNMFQRMKNVQENGTTCSREWNMFQRMEHVQENGTCTRKVGRCPNLVLIYCSCWSESTSFIRFTNVPAVQQTNKRNSFHNFSTFSTIQECKKIPLIHYGCRFLTLIAFPIYICIHKNYFLFSIFLVLFFHVTTYMQYKQSKLLKWLLKGIVIRDLRGLQTIFLEKSTVFPLK